MKIRRGFVSNSSSSSYVIVVKETDHDEILDNLHPYYRAWFDETVSPHIQKFLGKDVVVISTYISTEDEYPINYDGDYPPEAETYWDDERKIVYANTIMSKYQEMAQELHKNIIMDNQSC